MRMICMFDLPVDTDSEKKAYRNFRRDIMKEGFVMMQYSVYVRTCPSREYCHRLEKRIQKIAPNKGNVRLLVITEKQYQDMKIIIGGKGENEKMLGTERMIVL